MMKYVCALPLIFFWCIPLPVETQTLSSIRTRWSDSFVEWELYAVETADPEISEEFPFGELKLRWLQMKDDWSEWDFSLGETLRGTIKQKWKDDPSQWELRTYQGDVVTMRASWSNDLSEWRVTNNDISIVWRSRWTSQLDEWQTQNSNYGSFYLYTEYEGDPRDWSVQDKFDTTISEPMKLALIFLTIFHSSPRL